MRRVVIESPYAGDIERNVQYARECLLDSLRRGEAPICSHLLYPQVLNDVVPQDRLLGIDAGLMWSKAASVIVFCTDLGWSEGMQRALAFHKRRDVPIEYRSVWQ